MATATEKGLLIRLPYRATIIAVFVVTLSVFANIASAGTITLMAPAEADAFLMSGNQANMNWGDPAFGFSPFAVGHQNAFTGNQIGRQLYRFNVPASYTDLGPIISATLQLKVFDNFAGVPYQTAVYGLSDAWNEMTVTWNTQPAAASPEIDSVLVTNSGFGHVFDYHVTSYIQDQVLGGDVLLSFQQRGQDETVVGGVRWWQREGEGRSINRTVGRQPWLSIVMDAPWTDENIIMYVPEPAILLLLGLGLICLAGVRKKSKN